LGWSGVKLDRAEDLSPERTPCLSFALKVSQSRWMDFGAGPDQDLNNPLGVGGTVPSWMGIRDSNVSTTSAGQRPAEKRDRQLILPPGASTTVGAWILGRNMCRPGPWALGRTRAGGVVGRETRCHHVPVFVLTSLPRPPLVHGGRNTFHFVNGGHHPRAGARPRSRQRQGCAPGWRSPGHSAVSLGSASSTRCTSPFRRVLLARVSGSSKESIFPALG